MDDALDPKDKKKDLPKPPEPESTESDDCGWICA